MNPGFTLYRCFSAQGEPASSSCCVAKLPVAAVALMSLAPLILPERGQRIRAAIVTVSLCILSHNLSYFQGWEYQYTTFLPLLPAMLWLRRRESGLWLRRLLLGSLLVLLLVCPADAVFPRAGRAL